MMKIIKFENVSCEFEDYNESGNSIQVLNDINLSIEKGSFTAIVGRNGSGKSTMAKCMNALIQPAKGNVLVFSGIENKELNTKNEDDIWQIRKNNGMVFQNPDSQIVSAIVEDDVAFGPENIGMPPEQIRQVIDKAMEVTGIYELRLRETNKMSGGQKQRVAIAGVLAMQPECVIFDEASSMLDPSGRTAVMQIIKKLHESGTTIVMITHDMEETLNAERIVVLDNGKIISDGEPAEIFSSFEIIEAAGLSLPESIKIRKALCEAGIEVPDDVLGIEPLAEFIAGKLRERKQQPKS